MTNYWGALLRINMPPSNSCCRYLSVGASHNNSMALTHWDILLPVILSDAYADDVSEIPYDVKILRSGILRFVVSVMFSGTSETSRFEK